jgi:tRNA (guanine37-N1)-methyltransferase
MYAKGIRVSLQEAENARRELIRAGAIDSRLLLLKDEKGVVIPVIDFIDGREGWEPCFAVFREKRTVKGGYRELPRMKEWKELLPSSFDILGSKALIRLPPELYDGQEDIGKAILQVNSSIDSVFRDDGVHGEYRIRRLTLIAGRSGTETSVSEYGLKFRLDVAKTFYSPRLAVERMRISSAVGPGESILDMFAGVGPFSIAAARAAVNGNVIAFDINPYALSYLKENAALNRITNVECHLRDSISVEPGRLFDRIIMNLPQGGERFIGKAMSLLREHGTIHYYERTPDAGIRERTKSLESGFSGLRVIEARRVKGYSPADGIYHFLIKKSR